MVDKGQRHTDFSNMLTVFLSFGKLWTFWDSPYFVLLFKKVNHFGEIFMNVEIASLRLAEDAKMKDLLLCFGGGLNISHYISSTSARPGVLLVFLGF